MGQEPLGGQPDRGGSGAEQPIHSEQRLRQILEKIAGGLAAVRANGLFRGLFEAF